MADRSNSNSNSKSNNHGTRDEEDEEPPRPRSSFRQADDGIASSAPASIARPSSTASRSSARNASAIDNRINEKQRARGPRATRPGAVAEMEATSVPGSSGHYEPGVVTTTSAAVARAEQDTRSKNRSRRTGNTDTVPGAVMERSSQVARTSAGEATALDQLEQDALAKAISSRPGAVASAGGNQAGKSSRKSSTQSIAARRTASTHSAGSAGSSVGAVSASGGRQQIKASGRSAAQSQAANMAAVSVADQRSTSLRNMEADVIAKDLARPRSNASARSMVVGAGMTAAVAATSRGAASDLKGAPDALNSMRRVEADVLSKETVSNQSTSRSSARPTATAVNDDGFGDATVYQPQQDMRAAAHMAPVATATTIATGEASTWDQEALVETAPAAVSSGTYAGAIPLGAGPIDGGIEAFVAEKVLSATGVAVVLTDEEEELLERKKYRRYMCYGAFAFILLVVAIVVPVVILAGGPAPERVPTTSPTSFPTHSPSLSPTTVRLDQAIAMLSPISGAQAFIDISTPQYQAASWVSDEDELQLPLDSPQFLQRYYLATFYFAMDGENWVQCGRRDPTCGGDLKAKSWLLGSESECDWLAIGCNDNRSVEKIQFLRTAGNNLRGVLPFELSFLTDIGFFSVYNNYISGTIPSFLGSLTKLSQLFLLGNQFTGTLSEDIFKNLNLLSVLQLGFMTLNGTIPSSLTALPLSDVRLESNQFTGTVPAAFGSISSLQYFEFQSNRLTGSIPDALLSSQTIKTLRLHNNEITGTISSTIGGMTMLQDFRVGSNRLTGTLPTEIFSLPLLYTLNVTSNMLMGTLSEDFAFLANSTRSIILDHNNFTGPIPAAFDNFLYLSKFMLKM